MYELPLISICISSYNYEEPIINALRAIKRQKYTRYEVVICDDHSTDHSVSKIQKFMKENPEINIKLYVNEKNEGILKTKSSLIEYANGDYIIFCDSDDWMDDECLEKLAQAAISNDADCVVGKVCDITSEGKILQIQDFSKTPSKWMCSILHGTLYKRSIMIDNNIRFRIMPEDAYFILKFNQYSKKVIFLDEVVYYWRVHIDSEGRNKKNVSPAWITSHFKDICSFYKETINWEQCNNISNRELSIIEFSLLKQYYLLPLHALRFLRHKKRFECYDVLHNTLKQNFPNYLDNPYLKIGRESPARKYATNIIRTCAIFEKFHVFKCVLFLYYIVRKFVYFDE